MTVTEFMATIKAAAKQKTPHRFAPDGDLLARFPATCHHSQEERNRGCGDPWSHRKEAWKRWKGTP